MSEDGQVRTIPEAPDLPFSLGRHVQHDPRSRAFPAAVAAVEIRERRWRRRVPVYDQGNLGSCTAQAAVGCLSTAPFTHRYRSQSRIRATYSLATALDEFAGQWPTDDTGSSALGVCKALLQQGKIREYRWCFGLTDVLVALQSGPLITGTNWYSQMFYPNTSGLVRVAGSVAGGHEWCLVGVEPDRRLLWAANSWGESWGAAGFFALSYADYDRLLHEQGDATVLVT